MSRCIRCHESYDPHTLICEDCEQAMHEASTVAAIVKAVRVQGHIMMLDNTDYFADWIESGAWKRGKEPSDG